MSAQAQIGNQPGEIAALLHERFSRLSRQLRHMELPTGMTPERLSTLSVIDRNGPISVTALADREMVRPATMSRMVSALVDDGLVRRREDKADGRGVLVSVTAKGRRIFRRAHQQRLEQLADALSGLSKEQLASMRNLASVLEHLTSLLNQAHPNES
jgi:DNA-binding MarR family transcriptional regulator